MANLGWYMNRLRAMSAPEVAWRLAQKRLERAERKRFGGTAVPVDGQVLYGRAGGLEPDWGRLPLNAGNRRFSLEREIDLLGSYSYADYRTRWHAGFQTEAEWPMGFSADLEYRQRDDIGDARTNWELNRCHQFALLAKDWHASRDARFLGELDGLERDWARENPFLRGISWTSAMEVAIRCINWMYAAAFLEASLEDAPSEGQRMGEGAPPDAPGGALDAARREQVEGLGRRLATGALNMACYVAGHYSRYSSANNHVIVEACCLGLAGTAFGEDSWVVTADSILDAEIPRQNHPDGVNREQCLHYQVFFMEAVGLYLAAKRRNGVGAPQAWNDALSRMCAYVQDCRVAPGAWLEFGDDDEGAVLNLCGRKPDACEYALQLMGAVLEGSERWSDYEPACETLRWLCDGSALARAAGKELRGNDRSATYPDGGVTVMRSAGGRVVAGIDHGPLGFGSIAAHGHADALSFQFFVDGKCVVGDPGTYLYHCDAGSRDWFRSTAAHSTVCVGGRDQSQMLGAFMWGRRAECATESCELGQEVRAGGSNAAPGRDVLVASHDGYAPATHRRTFEFDRATGALQVTDELAGLPAGTQATASFPLAPGIAVSQAGGGFTLDAAGARLEMRIGGRPDPEVAVEERPFSAAYGVKRMAPAVCARVTPDASGRAVIETTIARAAQ